MQIEKMSSQMRFIAEGLQMTARVLTVKQAHAQAQMQEAVSMLLGMCILDMQEDGQVRSSEISSLPAQILTQRMALCDAPVLTAALAESGLRLLQDKQAKIAVLMVPVHDDIDWESLPVHLQNFINRENFPAHLLIAIQTIQFPGEPSDRFYALPVTAIQLLGKDATIKTQFRFSDPGLVQAYASNPGDVGASAAKDMEPYFRLQGTYLATLAEQEYERAKA